MTAPYVGTPVNSTMQPGLPGGEGFQRSSLVRRPRRRPLALGPSSGGPAMQPAVPAPAPPAAPGTFTATQNLLGTQVSPTPSTRLQRLGTQAETAATQLAGYGGVPAYRRIGPEAYGDYTSGARGQLGAAEQDIAGVDVPTYGRIAPTEFGTSRALLGEAATLSRGEALPRFGGIEAGTFDPGAAAGRARELTAGGLESLAGTPSRQQLAEETYRRLEGETVPETARQLRALGQRAASLGRLGSGMVTEEAGDIFGERALKLANIRKQLATETAGQELGDRLARLEATRGTAGQLLGEDLATAGFRRGLREEARGEREAELGEAYRRAGLGLERGGALRGIAGQEAELDLARRAQDVGERGFEADIAARRAGLAGTRAGLRGTLASQLFGMGGALREEERGERGAEMGRSLADLEARRAMLSDLTGAERGRYGQEAAEREELRGERGFQVGEEQRAIENAMRRRFGEEELLGGRFGREMERLRLVGGYGFGGVSPTEVALAGELGQEGTDLLGGAADLIRGQYGQPRGEPEEELAYRGATLPRRLPSRRGRTTYFPTEETA